MSVARKRLAVLGHPVGHSRSPAMHNAALADLGLVPEWSYEAIDVAPGELQALLAGMEGRGFVGANVTIPHKEAALALADEASDRARAIGAANTLTFSGGRVIAENTDAPGLIAVLPRPPAGMRALVLGAGGAGRAAVWALLDAGAAVSVWNRTPERAERLAAELGAVAVGTKAAAEAGKFDLIVNTTSVGLPTGRMSTQEAPAGPELMPLPVAADALSDRHIVVDLVYGTDRTQLIALAESAGAAAVGGLDVLVAQGVESLSIWTGREPSRDVMKTAAETNSD